MKLSSLNLIENTFPTWLRSIIRSQFSRFIGLIMILSSTYVTISIIWHNSNDPSLSHINKNIPTNLLGNYGAVTSDIMLQFWGFSTITIVYYLFKYGAYLVINKKYKGIIPRILYLPLIIFFLSALFSSTSVFQIFFNLTNISWPYLVGFGGLIGDLSYSIIVTPIEKYAIIINEDFHKYLISVVCILAIVFLRFVNRIRFKKSDAEKEKALNTIRKDRNLFLPFKQLKILVKYLINSLIARFKRENNNGNNEFNKIDTDYQNNFSDNNNLGSDSSNFSYNSSDPMFSNVKHDNEETSTPKKPRTKKPKINAQNNGELDLFNKAKYQLPSVSLLQQPSSYASYETIPKEELFESAERLKTVLKEFGVEGEIVDVRPGPVITLYELEPAPGLRAGRVISLAEDIARSMSVISARVAIVPGRNIIGIELPNEHRNVVYLNEILNTKEFIQSKHTLALALGKNIGGEPVIVDLPSMPHLLVAGTTGSGKSVGINTIILSLLYRYTPDECKLIMIDPKMLELSVYDGIPHLLSPVVTEPKKAVVALKWTLTEMERRYKNMAKLGVRNIIGFNDKIKKSIANGEVIKNTVQLGFDLETGKPNYVTEEMKLQTMPYIVVIVDEMADLMAVAGKEVDMTISRLAAMARAAGIHIIMATQRPSTDVITGVIKSNLPTRISFQVSSKIDSRVVLGESGAEQLLGKGDMLYMASGGRINRVHGAFVDDYEVENVVNFLKKQAQPEYIAEITVDTSANDSMYNSQNSNDEKQAGEDHLYDKAIEVVSMDRKASTSYIQRKLSIGYNRAANIIERMEEDGIVGPADHAGRREILLPEHNYDKI